MAVSSEFEASRVTSRVTNKFSASAMSALPPVVGINQGNSYAVFTKERVTECIKNRDGERQISCAIAFIGFIIMFDCSEEASIPYGLGVAVALRDLRYETV